MLSMLSLISFAIVVACSLEKTFCRDFIACMVLFFVISHLGDSATIVDINANATAGINSNPNTAFQLLVLLNAKDIVVANKIPKEINNWKQTVALPRKSAGIVSAIYIGVIIMIMPEDNPVISRPIVNSMMDSERSSETMPNIDRKAAMIRSFFRPSLSERRAAMGMIIATPHRNAATKIDTAVSDVANVFFMKSRTPDMAPILYP